MSSGNLSEIKSDQRNQRLNSRQMHNVRMAINVTKIVKRLEAFCTAAEELIRDPETGETVSRPIEMSANQVRAASILLNKCMPDLQSTQLEVKPDLEGVSTAEIHSRLKSILEMSEVRAGIIEAVQVGSVDDLLKG